MRTIFLLLVAVGLHAEYLRIEQEFGGMDCASCANFVQGKLGKNPNVQSVTIDNKKGLLTVVLKPGNTMRVGQVRDFVQQSGYQPKDASVVVVGQAVMDRGRSKLKVSEKETILVRDDDTEL